MKAKILRYYSGINVTLGVWKFENIDHKPLYTLEPAWKNNQDNISCIPTGTYEVVPHSGPKYKNVYEVRKVVNREGVLIHILNHPDETEGCIGVGRGVDPTTPMIFNSAVALGYIRSLVGKKQVHFNHRKSIRRII